MAKQENEDNGDQNDGGFFPPLTNSNLVLIVSGETRFMVRIRLVILEKN